MRKFKTESKRLLDLMINSIYTNKDIFLRELISNGSDALDKLYLAALKAGDTSIVRGDLHIDVLLDPLDRTITIIDNGIGMDKDALEKNLGTIAHSGSLEFKSDEEVKENEEVDIIGQFGVGFYSSFMVADKVQVISRAYGDDAAYVWESNGLEGYTIAEGQRDECGTTIILTIREDTDDVDYSHYLTPETLQELITRYSDYVRYPIRMELDNMVETPRPEDAGDDYEPTYEHVTEMTTVNSMVPIWTRRKGDVSDEEYNEFYKAQFHDPENPAKVISLHAEGNLNYDALLFIPSHMPEDFKTGEFKKGLALYSSNVLIMDKCADLLPDAFSFVYGVIDSPDLSLNISREILQQDRQLTAIARRIEKKIKSELVKLMDQEREDYEKFFDNFGHILKYNVYSSNGSKRDLLEDLLLFYSAKEEKMVSLDEYTSACDEEQDKIFFACGSSIPALANMPLVKSVLAKDYDVLLCGDSVDEFCLMTLMMYNEKFFMNVENGDLGLDTEEEIEEKRKAAEENEDLFADMVAMLDGKISAVETSSILEDVPACISVAEGSISLAMEKYLQSVPEDIRPKDAPTANHVLLLNPKHPVFEKLQKAQADGDTDTVEKYSKLLYYQSLVAEGLNIEDTADFCKAITDLM